MITKVLPHAVYVCLVLSAVLQSLTYGFLAIAILVVVLLLVRVRQHESMRNTIEEILPANKVSVVAHRGGAHDAPENTLAAFREAKKNGADGVEFDIDFTRDGVAVVLHDHSVNRTTDGSGKLSHMTLAEVRRLDASAKHPHKDKYPNEKIPTLEEAVVLCLDLQLKMFIDVKDSSSIQKTIEILRHLYAVHPQMYTNAVVCSFHPQVIYAVKKFNPKIVTGLTHRPWVLSRKVDGTEFSGPWYKCLMYPVLDVLLEWSHTAWLWYLCGNNVDLMFQGTASSRNIAFYHDRDIAVIVWTVNDAHQQEYLRHTLKTSYMTDTMHPGGCESQRN